MIPEENSDEIRFEPGSKHCLILVSEIKVKPKRRRTVLHIRQSQIGSSAPAFIYGFLDRSAGRSRARFTPRYYPGTSVLLL